MCSGAEAVGSHSGHAFADLAATYTVYYLGWLQESQFDEVPKLNLLGSFIEDSSVILCGLYSIKNGICFRDVHGSCYTPET